MGKIHFLGNINMQKIPGFTGIFDVKTLILIILNLTFFFFFFKKKKNVWLKIKLCYNKSH